MTLHLVSPNSVVWAALLFCLAIPVQALGSSLQTCLNLARQQTAQQVTIQTDCPALFKGLQNDGLLSSIDPPFEAEVTVRQLELLADSLLSVRNPGSIHQDGLDSLLTDILNTETDDPESNWWQALLKWLDSIKPAEHEAQYQQLQRWLEAIRPSEQAMRIFAYLSIALLLALSAWLVLSELHQAGFFRRFSDVRKPFTPRDTRQTTLHSPEHPSLTALSPRNEIAALLAQAINALAQHKLIPTDPSLTPRQLLVCLGAQAGDLNSAFSQVVYVAEPLLYGDHAADQHQLADYRRQIQVLLGKISS